MKMVSITVSMGKDGFYTVYCSDHPSIMGGGNTLSEAIEELRETLRLIKSDGKEVAYFYPEWLDDEYEFEVHWNIQDLMEYYAGIFTPTALGRLSGIHPKQVWSYMSGRSKPRRAQLEKIESALRRLGQELTHMSLR